MRTSQQKVFTQTLTPVYQNYQKFTIRRAIR